MKAILSVPCAPDAARGRINRPSFLILAALWGAAGCFFYVKYVPLVPAFQAVLIPILALVFLVTVLHFRRGTLLFVFFLPLINNLPYFFGLFEPLPVAPMALVLFLSYFLGWLVRQAMSKAGLHLPVSPTKPLILFSAVVAVSALVTFFRYSNFFPLLSGGIYELKTNVAGVTAGGAIMSLVFNSLNYLTGALFLFVLLSIDQPKRFIKPVLGVLCFSSLISLSFGLFQCLHEGAIGNNPISIRSELINATFKDALAFGAYLAMIIPLLLGAFLAFRGLIRWVSLVIIGLSFFMILFSGSKIAIFSSIISVLLFAALAFPLFLKRGRSSKKQFLRSKRLLGTAVCLAAVVVAVFFIVDGHFGNEIKDSNLYNRLKGLERALDYRLGALWKMALAMIRDYPLTGVGVGGYIIEVSNYARWNEVQLESESAENYILQAGSELGLIGLFLVLWIGWEILRQMRRSYSKLLFSDNLKILLIGVIAAMFSFFLNVLVHSHIGSFEIQYTFGLLVGLVYWLGSRDEEKGDKVIFSRKFIASSCLLIALFGGVHLWNSTHSLSLKSRTEQFGLKQDFGFYPLEETSDGREFRWMGSHGGITLRVEKAVMVIPLLASHPDLHRYPVTVEILLIKDFFREQRLLTKISLRQNVWHNAVFSIPDEEGREVILLFKVSRTWNPSRAIGAADRRNLGVAVGRIEFEDSK